MERWASALCLGEKKDEHAYPVLQSLLLDDLSLEQRAQIYQGEWTDENEQNVKWRWSFRHRGKRIRVICYGSIKDSISMAKRKEGYCYLCGVYRNKLTRDHIPPKNLAPRTSDSVFLYAYACSQCNNALSHDESKFRDFLSITCSDENNGEANDALENFKSNIRRNGLGRAGRPHKDLLRVLRGIRDREIYTPSRVYVGRATVVSPSPDIDIRAILLKIARGLHMVHTGEIVPSYYRTGAGLYGDEQPFPPLELGGKLSVLSNVGAFFQYRGGWPYDDPKAGA